MGLGCFVRCNPARVSALESCQHTGGDACKVELLDAGNHFGGVVLVVEFIESHHKRGGFAVAADKVATVIRELLDNGRKFGVVLALLVKRLDGFPVFLAVVVVVGALKVRIPLFKNRL